MDPNMKQLQESLADTETDAKQVLLARHQLVENDKIRNANREALTALHKQARTTKTSGPSPFEVIMKVMEGSSGKQLIMEICPTCQCIWNYYDVGSVDVRPLLSILKLK
ncbi:hypothetical protein BS78_09G078200 [Paspalum vaginatum]|nr:hypothetical protein BS78_09G078200 [Paspalum vaginatum]KAJ1262059.1 hypothetical protein BS78_09G078200 [Paspalum vaginatum]